MLETLLTLPNWYRLWWLNLLQSNPFHVLVETLLIVLYSVSFTPTLCRLAGSSRTETVPTERQKPLGAGGGCEAKDGGGSSDAGAGGGQG